MGILLASLVLGALSRELQQFEEARFKSEVKIVRKADYRYLLSKPEGYGRRRVPLLVFLHGAGERGSDLQAVAVHGPLKEIAKGRKLPFLVAAPQCPRGQWWDADLVNAFVEHLVRTYRIDRDRVYLTGLSMGGFGTWSAAAKRPDLYAAILPICGGIDPDEVTSLVRMPIWTVHGDADMAVPISETVRAVDRLKELGASPRFDIVRGGGHDVWTDVYASDATYQWMMAQKRVKNRS
jgi:predicted peptidase